MGIIILISLFLDRMNLRFSGTFGWQPDAVPLEQDLEIRVGNWVCHKHNFMRLDRNGGLTRRSAVVLLHCLSGGWPG